MAPKKYITIGEYSLIGLGALLLVIAIIVGARHQRKTHKEDVYAKVRCSPFKGQDFLLFLGTSGQSITQGSLLGGLGL